MDGNALSNEAFLTTVTDTNWEIAWIGDFNRDQLTDMLCSDAGTAPTS